MPLMFREFLLEESIEFDGGKLIDKSIIEKYKFDMAVIALSKNNPIVLNIVRRLGKYCKFQL